MLLCLAALLARAEAPPSLDEGYNDLYNLDFAQAHRVFQDWERTHPDDPMGPVSDAAAYLFAEFDRLHILQSEFFVHDEAFRRRERLAADPAARQAFDRALDRTSELAARRLARDPDDENALLASVLRYGLRADYLGLIEKSYLASLGDMKRGRALAERLLAKHPRDYDAYLALGVENYVLSLKPVPVRWLLRMGGAQTDRATGLRQLRLTAENGHYLRPYARLLLAVAALRDHDRRRAGTLLAGLAAQFPNNPLYREELARLRSSS